MSDILIPNYKGMHRCLRTPEMVDEIFSYLQPRHIARVLDPPAYRHIGINTLAALARTCKLLSPAASKRLWEYLPTLLHLFRVLPSSKYRLIKVEEIKVSKLEIIGTLSAEDLGRLLFYAPYVRHVGQGNVILDEAFSQIHAQLPPQHIFLPLLRTLSMDDMELSVNNWVKSITTSDHKSAQLHSIYLMQTTSKSDKAEKVLKTVASYASQLKLFKATIFQSLPDLDVQLIQICASFQSLHTFHMDCDLPAQALLHLSGIKSLEILEICVKQRQIEELDDLLGPDCQALPFLNLKCLKLAAMTTFLYCLRFLTKLQLNGLDHLYITHLREDGNVWDLGLLFNLLHDIHGLSKTLKTLVIRQSFIYPSESQSLKITPRSLENLFDFRELSQLVIERCDTSALDDVTVLEMGASWPKIRKLGFLDYSERFSTGVSLIGLQFLILGCQQLTELAIRIDAKDIPQFAPLEPASTSPLKIIDLLTSRMGDNVKGFADLFRYWCPAIEGIQIKLSLEEEEGIESATFTQLRWWAEFSSLLFGENGRSAGDFEDGRFDIAWDSDDDGYDG